MWQRLAGGWELGGNPGFGAGLPRPSWLVGAACRSLLQRVPHGPNVQMSDTRRRIYRGYRSEMAGTWHAWNSPPGAAGTRHVFAVRMLKLFLQRTSLTHTTSVELSKESSGTKFMTHTRVTGMPQRRGANGSTDIRLRRVCHGLGQSSIGGSLAEYGGRKDRLSAIQGGPGHRGDRTVAADERVTHAHTRNT